MTEEQRVEHGETAEPTAEALASDRNLYPQPTDDDTPDGSQIPEYSGASADAPVEADDGDEVEAGDVVLEEGDDD